MAEIRSARSFTVKKAESLHLTGYVTNTSDGKVLPSQFFQFPFLFKGHVETTAPFIFQIRFLYRSALA